MKKLVSALVLIVLSAGFVGCGRLSGKSSGLTGSADVQLSCVAKFLASDGSWYLTEQRQQVYAESKAVRFTADEPGGRISWFLTDGDVVIKQQPKGRHFDTALFGVMTSRQISSGLLELYLAGLGGFDGQKGSGENIVFEGRIYESVLAVQKNVGLYYSESTRRNDLVIIQGQEKYALCGYNYLKLNNDSYIPSKIDVYTYQTGRDRKLIAQYSCRPD